MGEENKSNLQSIIKSVLGRNTDKPFVKRILDPNRKSIKNEDGTESTHLMAWGSVDNKHIVYPTITETDGVLKKHGDKEAITKALKEDNFIEFKTPAAADLFSKAYKLGTNQPNGFKKGADTLANKEQIKPFQQTKEKKSFSQQYVKATKLEQFLKTRVEAGEQRLMSDKDLLKQTQSGMALMIKHAEGHIINKKESLDGMEGLRE